MGVRFSADARRIIVVASTLAEARGLSRPRLRDLLDALTTIDVALPEIPAEVLEDDIESVLGAAADLAGHNDLSIGVIVSVLHGVQRGEIPTGEGEFDAEAVTALGVVALPATRVGIGYDSHRFAPGGPMILGGIAIDADAHCAGHSDGDAVCHALTDAVLGAANAGDIGELFPDTDPANAGRNSLGMLADAVARVRATGYAVSNADVTVVAETPKIGPHRDAMRAALAGALGVPVAMVSVKGKTNERMGWIGHGEGLASIAIVMLVRRST